MTPSSLGEPIRLSGVLSTPRCSWPTIRDTCAGRYVACACGWWVRCYGKNEARRLHARHLTWVKRSLR